MPTLRTTVELQFGGRCGRAPQGMHVAFGRAVLLGDGAALQGSSFLAAPLAEGVACAWGVRPDSRVVVWALNARQKDSFHQERIFKSGRVWADLARGAYAHAAQGTRRMPGLDLMVLGDLPMGEGLGSSAAYLIVLLRSIHEAIGQYRSRWELAEDVPTIERAWGGVETDVPSAYTVAAAKPGQILHVDAEALDHRVLKLVVGHGLRTEPTGLGTATPEAPTTEDFSAAEAQRVARGIAALEAADMAALGACMRASHEQFIAGMTAGRDRLDACVSKALARPGCLGVRLARGGRLAILERLPV